MADNLDNMNEVDTDSVETSEGFDVGQTRPQPYANEPLYRDLLRHYQNADWDKSLEIVGILLEDYPEDPALVKFQHEIEMRNTLHRLGEESQKSERRQKLGKTAVNVLIVLAIILGISFAGLFGYNQYQNSVEQARLEREQAALEATLLNKYENALNFLEGGRANEALKLFEEITEIDPDYEDVPQLIVEANDLIALDAFYEEGRAEYEAGNLEGAREIFQEIVDNEGSYKDSSFLLREIENRIEINRLRDDAETAYQQEDWQSVVDISERIKEINPNEDLGDLKLLLFTSYLKLVIAIADNPEVSQSEIDAAAEYYLAALSLFPQNRELAEERAELQREAINLLANKYFIYALELIESENFTIDDAEEALSLLKIANNLGSGSPEIASEINLLQLYLSALNNFNNRRWSDAIEVLEELNLLEPSYANGMVQYLLYESYMGQGDTLLSFAEYSDAQAVYEKAETFAWGDTGNNLRLFQIEIRIGYALRRLSLAEEAAEYFRFAANLVNFSSKLTSEYPDTLEAFTEAENAMDQGDYWNAARLYEIAFENVDMIYEFEEVNVNRGDIVAQISFQRGSTVGAILLNNDDLGDRLVVRSDQVIMVPVLAED